MRLQNKASRDVAAYLIGRWSIHENDFGVTSLESMPKREYMLAVGFTTDSFPTNHASALPTGARKIDPAGRTILGTRLLATRRVAKNISYTHVLSIKSCNLRITQARIAAHQFEKAKHK